MSLLAGHNEGHGLDGVQLLFGQCPNREVNIFIGASLNPTALALAKADRKARQDSKNMGLLRARCVLRGGGRPQTLFQERPKVWSIVL